MCVSNLFCLISLGKSVGQNKVVKGRAAEAGAGVPMLAWAKCAQELVGVGGYVTAEK